MKSVNQEIMAIMTIMFLSVIVGPLVCLLMESNLYSKMVIR